MTQTNRNLVGIQPPPAGEDGSGRALTHGATSEQRLAPLRQAHADALRADYPGLDDRRLALLADRLARVDSARRWLDDQDGLVRNKAGEPYPLVDRLEKWVGAAERRLDELEVERRQAKRFSGLEAFMVTEGDGDGTDAA